MNTAVYNQQRLVKAATVLLCGMWLGLAMPAWAIEDHDFIDSGVLEGNDGLEAGAEIGGLLLDETHTRFGHELFDVFNRAWKPPEGARYNIEFDERVDPLRGSFITIKLNEQVIFEGLLQPKSDLIAELGKGLARDIRTLLRNNQNLEEEEFY